VKLRSAYLAWWASSASGDKNLWGWGSVVSLFLTSLALTNAALVGRTCGLVSVHLGPFPFGVAVDAWSLRFYSLLGLIAGVVVC